MAMALAAWVPTRAIGAALKVHLSVDAIAAAQLPTAFKPGRSGHRQVGRGMGPAIASWAIARLALKAGSRADGSSSARMRPSR